LAGRRRRALVFDADTVGDALLTASGPEPCAALADGSAVQSRTPAMAPRTTVNRWLRPEGLSAGKDGFMMAGKGNSRAMAGGAGHGPCDN